MIKISDGSRINFLKLRKQTYTIEEKNNSEID